MTKELLSGNEAIARGAYEAGIAVGVGYPGTPSTEILENYRHYPDVYAEWSINEKVALEVGIGAALAGRRTLVTMKHVGLNVAADPLFTLSYIGIKGGLVIANADDPNMHSSQNEQDNRHYARSAKIPMLEPSDSQEAKDFVKTAIQLSEKHDTPVILRTVTRISHSKTLVSIEQRDLPKTTPAFEKNIHKYVMIPAFARKRHQIVEARMTRLQSDVNSHELNRIEPGTSEMAFITSGICYQYVRECFPDASVLKLGIVHPLPMDMIRTFCSTHKMVYVIEELEPFIENQIKAAGIMNVNGKDLLPVTGEYSPALIRKTIADITPVSPLIEIDLPPRPPALCPGCPHRQTFNVLKELNAIVTGDIGCYTLGVLPPFSSMDTCVDMGASITVAQGIEIATNNTQRPLVAVIGDSTFAHSGITGLYNAAYNQRHSVIIVLDNSTTAMTGMQPNPLSGETINEVPTIAIDYVKCAEAVGLQHDQIRIVNAYSEEDIRKNLKELIASDKLSLMVVKGPCVILKRKLAKRQRTAS